VAAVWACWTLLTRAERDAALTRTPAMPPSRGGSREDVLTARFLAVLRAGDIDALRSLALLSGLPADANRLPSVRNGSGTGWERGSGGIGEAGVDSGGGAEGADTVDENGGGDDDGGICDGAGDGGGRRYGERSIRASRVGADESEGAGGDDRDENESDGDEGDGDRGEDSDIGGEGGYPPDLAPCSLRGLVWKALLGLGPLDPHEYACWVRKGPSADDHRVREDARRTFSKNDDFCARVPNAKIIRVLNAYVHASGNTPGIYAQSMSLLAAPFLYVMPEPDAFHCFRVFLTAHVPQYVRRYAGARRGCRLLDRCLADVDPRLHALFARHNLNAEVYAFPSVSSLGACVPPISNTVRLWDIQLAFGAHMHIIFTLARLVLASSSILERRSGAPLITRELEQGLSVDAEAVLACAVPLVNQLDPGLYDELIDHARNPLPPNHPDHERHDAGVAAAVASAARKAAARASGWRPKDSLPTSPSDEFEPVPIVSQIDPDFEWPPTGGRAPEDGRESVRIAKISRQPAVDPGTGDEGDGGGRNGGNPDDDRWGDIVQRL
jgi:cell cycle arrest protein BUB2